MRIRFAFILLLIGHFSFAQDNSDMSALWSRTGILGTARTVGAGGAFGSVGADMGCIAINPAGLGLYRSTDFSISPVLQVDNNQAVYNGSNTIAHKVSFGLRQGGFVFTKIYKNAADDQLGHPLKSISFAFNFQETNSFNRRQNYNSTNSSSSLIDEYAALASINNAPGTGYPIGFDPPEIVVADVFNLIGFNTNTGNYFSNLKAPVNQVGHLETSGAINRVDFGLGTNFINKLYFGVNLAVPIINYTINNDFSESATGNNPSPVSDYDLTTAQSETGYGFNGIIGLIYRPFPFMRIGASYHLPTWYAMTENYSINMLEDTGGIQYSLTSNGQPESAPSFKYGLRTPMRGTFSASFYYKQYGFISIDYDMQNLGASRIHIPNDTSGIESGVNNEIKSTYKLNHTIHAGLEASIKILRLRAGYSFSTSPYKKDQEYTPGYNDVRNAFTAGIGVRLAHFYVDLAYVYAWQKDATVQLSNYNFPINSMANTSTVLLTVGWKFEVGAKNKNKSTNNQNTEQPRRYTPPPSDSDQKY